MHVPDGLCTDDRGRIYVANNSDDVSAIEVFDSDGRYAGKIAIPAPPSNCTFGGADRRTLYVTTLHAVYEVRVETPGLPGSAEALGEPRRSHQRRGGAGREDRRLRPQIATPWRARVTAV